MLANFFRFLTSLRLTVVLLALGLILVFWGTIAQVNLGLYKAQNDFFRSFLVYQAPPGLHFPIPFPGGYTIGGLLLVNLFAAHFRYYQPGNRKIGIVLIHLGVVLLLFGQLLTDLLSTESTMHLRHGDTKNYSEASSHFELAVIDTSDNATDKVLAIPGPRLRTGEELRHAAMPLTIKVQAYFPNSSVSEQPAAGFQQIATTAGIGSGLWWQEQPHETEMDKRDIPSGIVELLSPQGTLGTFFVSGYLNRPQVVTHDGKTYTLALRPVRFYKNYQIHLVEFKHDKYPGTEIPKNFSSRVRVQRPETGEDREVLIYMNSPLRYAGETYYQASFDPDNQGTVLQVVRNPSWLTPYFSCVMVGLGLIVQFTQHLLAFAAKRKAA